MKTNDFVKVMVVTKHMADENYSVRISDKTNEMHGEPLFFDKKDTYGHVLELLSGMGKIIIDVFDSMNGGDGLVLEFSEHQDENKTLHNFTFVKK